ncbi:resolvase, partial [Escherichia coli]|nr:resolvase [Escherichia coli]
MSHLPAKIFQISRSDAWNLTISPDAARNMR